MQTWNATLLHKTELELGEGTHWHPQWKKFLYVDIEGGKVGCIDPVTKNVKEIIIGKRIGTVVPADNGNLIIALQGSIEEINFDTGERKKLIDIEFDKPTNRCNEGKCDAAGRLWIGTMHMQAQLNKGALYCYDGILHKKIYNLSIPNGICWSADNKVMYHIDSLKYHIKAYDFNLETGAISNERIVIEINEPNNTPDGMCIDEQGMLWVAIWGGSCVNRYDPINGTLIGQVTVAAPHVTACAFGGNDMKQLFITTARAGLSAAQLQEYPLSGSFFHVAVNIKGMNMHQFMSNHLDGAA